MLSIAIDLSKKNFIFSYRARKSVYLAEDPCKHVLLNMKLENASVTGKKISSFALTIKETLNVYFAKLTFEPPCI